MKVSVRIDGELYSNNVALPIKWADLLDEQLDEARVSIKQVPIKYFPRLTPVEVCISYTNSLLPLIKNYVLSSDVSVETPVGSGLYNHDLMLIEETKILEGIVVDEITFNNDLGRIYTNNPKKVKPSVTSESGVPPLEPDDITYYYYTPIATGSDLPIISANDIFYSALHPDAVGVYRNIKECSIKIYANSVFVKEITDKNEQFMLPITSYSYKIEYFVIMTQYNGTDGEFDFDTTVTYEFIAVKNREPLPKWTIKTVIDRVLSLAETLRLGELPRFYLNHEQAEEFDKILSPEFAFTKATLREILNQIGGYINGIPRLRGKEISFDLLGSNEIWDKGDLAYVYNEYSSNIENYATKLDSNVDNLINLVDYEQSTIIEPYFNGYKTVRSEEVFARITDGNMIIETSWPIYEIRKLTAGFIPYNDFSRQDLTPYVFEEAEYSRMKSYKGEYPEAKAYALFYTQGQKHIKGLNFKEERAFAGAKQDYAVINILEEIIGENINTSNENFYPQLAFRVEYIPIYSARICQTKSYCDRKEEPRTLVFNQSENLIEARYYGENLKGAIARIGNVERTLTYKTKNASYIPKAGYLFDSDYYIAAVNVEVLPEYFNFTISLSKDFNRLSQYIGINSQKRFFEVSEKQVYERKINYTDYLIIGDNEEAENTLLQDLTPLVKLFTENNSDYTDRLSYVIATGIDDGGAACNKISLPILSSSLGRSMVFSFEYSDSYSAGNTVDKIDGDNDVSGWFGTGCEYADYYGKINALKFDMYSTGESPTSVSRQTEIGTKLPLAMTNETSAGVISTKDRPLIIMKNSTEKLSITVQQEFITNRKNLIIGSALARLCPLVTSKKNSTSFYLLKDKINKFADKISLKNAVYTSLVSSDWILNETFKLCIGAKNFYWNNGTANSWAFISNIDPVAMTGEILIGENIEPANGYFSLQSIYITPKHKIND